MKRKPKSSTREKKMKKKLFFTLSSIGIVFLGSLTTRGQSADVPKYEVAVDFTSVSLEYGTTLPGLGGRFTYNLNKHVALEAAGYFYPGKCASCPGQVTGRVTEGLFGVKVGKRFQKWGVFGKARPGFMSFSQGFFDIVPTGGGPFPFVFMVHRSTPFALDVGGVLEFYPSKRVVVRFDGGDTILRYPQRGFHSFTTDQTTGAIIPTQYTSPAFVRHNFQFIAGVGLRF
jgi:hypothetical protein